MNMSERGSFVTEYCDCAKCFDAAKAVLLKNDKYFCSIVIPMWCGNVGELPIIAGKIGGLYSGEELHMFESEILPELERVICHPMRIAVLAENGEKIFTVAPNAGSNGPSGVAAKVRVD